MYKFLQRGRVLTGNYSDYQIDTLTKGDSHESPLVRFDGIWFQHPAAKPIRTLGS